MADSHPPQSTNAPAAKTRNPVERIIVWGLIGVLLVAVAIEFQSRTSHKNVLTTLLSKVKAVDEDSTKPEVTEAVVREAVGNKKPIRAEAVTGGQFAPFGAKHLEVYSWFTLNPTRKREIWVFYGGKGRDSTELATVVEVRTSEDFAEPPEVAAATAGNAGNPQAGGPGGPGMGGPGMGGPGMGGGGMGASGGGPRGRPRTGAPVANGSEDADAEKTDAKAADAEKSDADKPSEEKPAAEKADEVKTDKSEDQTEKSDTDKE